jgi:hypothetical protein
MSQDDYGYFGPSYSYADNIPLPASIGVRQDPSVGAIIDAVAAVNTYADIIGFGAPTFFDQQNLQPMGIRYYLNTELKCSNGATMSAYTDNVPKGTALGTNIQRALASSGLPPLKGLAPGMIESAETALDPRPILSAVTNSGYPVCQQVQCPVGDVNGLLKNAAAGPTDPPFIVDPVQYVNGVPTQTRWVQAYDNTGNQITISKDEFVATPKCYNADGTYMSRPGTGCPPTQPQAQSAAGGSPYPLCTVLQPASLPPPLMVETFNGGSGGSLSDSERLVAAIALTGLGAALLWAIRRH